MLMLSCQETPKLCFKNNTAILYYNLLLLKVGQFKFQSSLKIINLLEKLKAFRMNTFWNSQPSCVLHY